MTTGKDVIESLKTEIVGHFFTYFVFMNTSQTSQPLWLPLQRDRVVKVAS